MSSTQVRFVDLQMQYRSLKQEIDEAILGVLDRGDFILGSSVTEFETAFAAYCEAEHCVGVGCGLDALTLALRGIGAQSGDEVIIPANTFIATAISVLHTGATPVLVEYDPATYNIDPACVERAITPKTKAIVPVHLYGQPADMERLGSIAARHGLYIVEDAAQAHGARYQQRRCGSFGHAAAFSFYPGKNLGAYGDGGAVVTNDKDLADGVRQARNYGSMAKYQHEILGGNSRLDSVQAAVLSVKLNYLDQWNEHRRSMAAAYHDRLGDLPIELPRPTADSEHVFHLYVIQTSERDELQAALRQAGIQTGIHYPIPFHLQPACRGRLIIPERLDQTERAAGRLLSLPMHPELTLGEVERVADVIRRQWEGIEVGKLTHSTMMSCLNAG